MRRRTATLATLLIVLATTAAAAPLSIADVARLRSVTAIAASPDGERIAYALFVPRDVAKEDGPGYSELHVVDSSGRSRPYITGEANVSDIHWTPDGRSISFLAKRGKDEFRSIYAIDLDGGEARRIVTHDADISSHSWAPDGRRLAFLATEAEPKKNKDLEKKGFNQIVYEETARPVRIWIAVPQSREKPRMLEVEGSASDLEWAPAGSLLAVALAPTPLVDHSYTRRKVTIVDADGGRITARIDNPGKLGPLAWSPDAKTIAFISAADRNDSAAGRLVVAPATGGAMREILPNYMGHVSDLAWRDATTIVYAGDEGVWSTLSEIRSDGSGRKTLVPAGVCAIGAIDLSANGRSVAIVSDTPSHPAEVFLWQSGMRAPRRLTDSNRWLASRELAPQEVVRYRARDGVEIEGLLIHPLNEEKGTRYPLIVVVHGGPEAHFRNGWLTSYSNPGQVAAGRGFAVFHPNYRGSTGRGVAFTKLSFGDPAGKEFDDLVDAVEHFVSAGLADRARVGITGGSYGGYASAWGATKLTEHFAASVMFVGISDLASKWGTTDIPEEEFLVHQGRHPWDDWMFHLQRSPVYWAAQSRTPTLILAGRDDPRVHPSQSLELYRHLRERGKAPVRLVLYPGEGHGNRRAASRLDYNLRMMQWFEHYLKGAGGAPPPYEISYELPEADEERQPGDTVGKGPRKENGMKKTSEPAKPQP